MTAPPPPTDPQAVVMSIVAQLGPLKKPDGTPFVGKLEPYAEGMVHYVAENLERFADIRHGDSFVLVSLTRGEESATHEFRSGHYVKDADEAEKEEKS